jgi:perosamine synthetase
VIPLSIPNIGEREKRYISMAVHEGYVSTGRFIEDFEKRLAECVGFKHVVAVNSGTSGLHLALMLLGIGREDEVIVPDLSFVATVNAVIYTGAKPVVVDVDYDTWTINLASIEKAITKRTKAIIPVHLYGNPSSMEEIMELANIHKLFVIEDACEALGAKYKRKGNIAVYSFNGNKIITTGSGGAIASNNKELIAKARILINQGRQPGQLEYDHEEIGYNYRMSNLQAALGIAQLQRRKEFIEKKKRINHLYRQELPQYIFQKEQEDCQSNWWLTCVLVEGNRREVIEGLLDEGVQARPVFKPFSQQEAYRNYNFTKGINAEHIWNKGICLPSSTTLEKEEIIEVCQTIKRLNPTS